MVAISYLNAWAGVGRAMQAADYDAMQRQLDEALAQQTKITQMAPACAASP